MKTKTHPINKSIFSEILLFIIIFIAIYAIYAVCIYLFNTCFS
nr:hypothetical protein [uncultured Pedobacter sp.]